MAVLLVTVFAGDKRAVAHSVCSPSLFMAHACFALLGGSFQVTEENQAH